MSNEPDKETLVQRTERILLKIDEGLYNALDNVTGTGDGENARNWAVVVSDLASARRSILTPSAGL